MKNIIWVDEYSVGVEEFDFHHKKFFSIINNIRKLNNSKKDINYFLKELANYEDYHLSREEQKFAEYNYPENDKHSKIHNEYRKNIKKFIRENEESKLKIKELLDFLEKWWTNHILKEDKRYTNFFHENGVF